MKITLIEFFLLIFFLQKIEKPFLSAVASTLGDRYTDNVENIYKISIKFIIETVVDGFNRELSKTSGNRTIESANKANNINSTKS